MTWNGARWAITICCLTFALAACGGGDSTAGGTSTSTHDLIDVKMVVPDFDGANDWVVGPNENTARIYREQRYLSTGMPEDDDRIAPVMIVERHWYAEGRRPVNERDYDNFVLDRADDPEGFAGGGFYDFPVNACNKPVWISMSARQGYNSYNLAAVTQVKDRSGEPAAILVRVLPRHLTPTETVEAIVGVLTESTGPDGEPMLSCMDPANLVDAILAVPIVDGNGQERPIGDYEFTEYFEALSTRG